MNKSDVEKLEAYERMVIQRRNAVKGWQKRNKDKVIEYKKEYVQKNRDKAVRYSTNYINNNKEKYKEYQQLYRQSYFLRKLPFFANDDSSPTAAVN
jgi:hypothetical protein